MADSKNEKIEQKAGAEKRLGEKLSTDDDLIMEHILHNINKTPIGLVLKRIASLPEVRQKKILHVRKQINDGRYDINKRLDFAIDKALEDIIK